MSGGGRGINMKSEREVIGLVNALVEQGARVEWGSNSGGRNGSGPGSFPAKVFPPNPEKHFILFHGSQSDANAATLKRNEVRRAGLTWPFGEEGSRKETTMTDEDGNRIPGQHLQVPAAVKNRKMPLQQQTLDKVKPTLQQMGPTFWSNEFADRLKSAGVSGFQATTGGVNVQRAMEILDYLGYRTVEAVRNRGGYSYRWEFDPEAPQLAGVQPSPPPPGTRTKKPQSAAAVPEPVAEAPKPTPAPGPKKHERVQCAQCERWFTPDGYQNHVDSTGHGAEVDTAGIEALRGEPVDLEVALAESPQVEQPVDGGEVPTESEESAYARKIQQALDYLRSTPMLQQVKGIKETNASLIDLLVEAQDRPDAGDDYRAAYDRGLAEGMGLAEGAQEEATNLRGQLGDASERIAELERAERVGYEKVLEAGRLLDERNERIRVLEEQEAAISAGLDEALTNARTLTTANDELERRLDALPAGNSDDDSWVIDADKVSQSYVSILVEQAARIGVTIEIRARRA